MPGTPSCAASVLRVTRQYEAVIRGEAKIPCAPAVSIVTMWCSIARGVPVLHVGQGQLSSIRSMLFACFFSPGQGSILCLTGRHTRTKIQRTLESQGNSKSSSPSWEYAIRLRKQLFFNASPTPWLCWQDAPCQRPAPHRPKDLSQRAISQDRIGTCCDIDPPQSQYPLNTVVLIGDMKPIIVQDVKGGSRSTGNLSAHCLMLWVVRLLQGQLCG